MKDYNCKRKKKEIKKKQEMFVKHWPPARSRWNTCLLDQYLHLTQYTMKQKVLDQHLYLTH